VLHLHVQVALGDQVGRSCERLDRLRDPDRGEDEKAGDQEQCPDADRDQERPQVVRGGEDLRQRGDGDDRPLAGRNRLRRHQHLLAGERVGGLDLQRAARLHRGRHLGELRVAGLAGELGQRGLADQLRVRSGDQRARVRDQERVPGLADPDPRELLLEVVELQVESDDSHRVPGNHDRGDERDLDQAALVEVGIEDDQVAALLRQHPPVGLRLGVGHVVLGGVELPLEALPVRNELAARRGAGAPVAHEVGVGAGAVAVAHVQVHAHDLRVVRRHRAEHPVDAQAVGAASGEVGAVLRAERLEHRGVAVRLRLEAVRVRDAHLASLLVGGRAGWEPERPTLITSITRIARTTGGSSPRSSFARSERVQAGRCAAIFIARKVGGACRSLERGMPG
jgi:hypothetical protein